MCNSGGGGGGNLWDTSIRIAEGGPSVRTPEIFKLYILLTVTFYAFLIIHNPHVLLKEVKF